VHRFIHKTEIVACAGSMLFDKLTTETMQKVFLSMNPLEVLPNTVIIQQGDEEASKFYVLESGTCEVLLDNDEGKKVVHQYKAGSYFGELALLYDQPRAATVRSTSKCKLWVMERNVYNAIYHQEMKEIRQSKLKLIQSMPIFKPLSETMQGTLCDVLKLQEHPASMALFYKGDEGDLFYIVKEGSVEITIGEKVGWLAHVA
jgi:CRP-like cAMP-binding protein